MRHGVICFVGLDHVQGPICHSTCSDAAEHGICFDLSLFSDPCLIIPYLTTFLRVFTLPLLASIHLYDLTIFLR